MTVLGWKVFEAINPVHAARLSCCDISQESTTSLRKVQTNLGEDNLYDARGKKTRYIHSQEGAYNEAREWVVHALKDLEEKTEILVIYGVGLGWYWKALLPWVERKKDRRILFIEDDLHIIGHLIESGLGNDFFSHPQTRLVALSGADDKESLDMIAWNLFRKKYRFLVSPAYANYRPKASKIVEDAVYVRSTDIHLVADEFSTFGIQHARNWLRNITLLQQSYNAQDLFQKFQGMTAVVVAAGPSAQETIPYLQKWKEKALVIAGGSSINVLLEAGITPHLAVTVDPNPLQYSRMKYLEPFQLPLLFRSRALYEGIVAANGMPLMYLKGSDGYPLVTYFENALGIEGETLDGGDSVSTLLIELAVALGVSSVVMVGYDLGYTEGKRYPLSLQSLLHESEDKIERNSEDISKEEYQISALSNSGKLLQTEAKWVVEGAWIHRFISQLASNVTVSNTSLEGLAIESVPYKDLESIDQEINLSSCGLYEDIASKVFACIYSCRSLQHTAAVQNVSKTLRDLSSSLQDFEEKAKNLCKIYQGYEETPNWEASTFAKRLELLNELESSFAFHNLLQPFWMMHTTWSEMKSKLELPYFQENWKEIQSDIERQSMVERLQFILEGVQSYQKLFFSYASWACLQGSFLPDPFEAAPWPLSTKESETPDLTIA